MDDTLCVGGRESLFAASSRLCFQFQSSSVAASSNTLPSIANALKEEGRFNTSLLFPRTRNLSERMIVYPG